MTLAPMIQVDDIDEYSQPEQQKKSEIKAGAKRIRRVAKATLLAEKQPYNPEIITQAVAGYERRDPTMPRRGRKPVREDIYI